MKHNLHNMILHIIPVFPEMINILQHFKSVWCFNKLQNWQCFGSAYCTLLCGSESSVCFGLHLGEKDKDFLKNGFSSKKSQNLNLNLLLTLSEL